MDQVVTPPPEPTVTAPPKRAVDRARDIKHRAEFALVWVAIKLFRALPMRVGVGFVAAVCQFVGPWLRQNRRAMQNLALAFPDYDDARRRDIARAMWANMGRVFAETFYIDRIIADPSRLGPGIAVAFVATIYGVALANLFFLPVANKLKSRARSEAQFREMMVEGIIAIAEGENPRAIELKLNGFVDPS